MLNTKAQMRMAWMGPAAIFVFMIALWPLAGFLPPISPNDSAEEIVNIYRDNTDGIRVGMFLATVAAAMMGPFYATITTQMKRIEGRFSVYAYTQLGLGMLAILLVVIPSYIMQGIAYRPDRDIDPEVIRLINDVAWLPFVGAFVTVSLQNIMIALAIFQDTEQRVFPRWLGYFNIWTALAFCPAAIEFFFTTGPFAWNGIFVFWLALSFFGVWFFVMFFSLKKAIAEQAIEEAALEADAAAAVAAKG